LKILVVEDDITTAEYLLRGLTEAGHSPEAAHDGRQGLSRASGAEPWDLLIVDRKLPHLDGLTMVRTLREGGMSAPVLFLTTLGSIEDRVDGLNAGADDYLVKPFALSELIARVAALGRRRQTAPATSLRVDDLEMDLLAREVRRGGQVIDLQPREFRLLEYLMQHADQVVTRAMLLEKVWDLNFDPHTNVVETHVSRLRSKVDKGHSTPLIHTIRGSGYSLRTPS
jgi:two-component system OmpR family response regulator